MMDPEFINYTKHTVSSLKNIAIVSIVGKLLEQENIKEELKKLAKQVREEERKSLSVIGHYDLCKVKEMIVEKLALLYIPKILHTDILSFVKPMGLQVIKCFVTMEKDGNKFYSEMCNEALYWSSWGTLDVIKALEQKVFHEDCDSENAEKLFEWACEYCSESCIVDLRKKLSKKSKQQLWYKCTHFLESYHLLAYWIFHLKKKLPKFQEHIKKPAFANFYDRNHSLHRNMMKLAISKENFVAVKYFWLKLTNEEKTNDNILSWLEQIIRGYDYLEWHKRQIPSECTDIMLFLLSNLSDQTQQRRFFQRHPKLILKAVCNHWPYQVYFLPTIHAMWSYLDKDTYTEIIFTIALEAKESIASKKLLSDLWNCSPKEFKGIIFLSIPSELMKELIGLK